MTNKNLVSEQDEQVMLRFRGRSTNPDGVYTAVKFIEGDELYNSVASKARGIVTLSPFIMLRVAQRGEEGLADFEEMLGKMNLDALVAYRAMFEMFRNNADAIESALNNSIVTRAVLESSVSLMPGFNQSIKIRTSGDVGSARQVLIDIGTKESAPGEQSKVEDPIAQTVVLGQVHDLVNVEIPRQMVNVEQKRSETSLVTVAPVVAEFQHEEKVIAHDEDEDGGEPVIPDLFGGM